MLCDFLILQCCNITITNLMVILHQDRPRPAVSATWLQGDSSSPHAADSNLLGKTVDAACMSGSCHWLRPFSKDKKADDDKKVQKAVSLGF